MAIIKARGGESLASVKEKKNAERIFGRSVGLSN